MKTCYRLILVDNKDKDVIIELLKNDYDNESLLKLKEGVKIQSPWYQCVPYFRNSLLYFQDLNCLKYFLFDTCKLTLDDINELDDLGYKLELCEVNSYSKGQSTLYYNIDLDEIENTNEINLKDLFKEDKNLNYIDIKYNTNIFDEDIKYCKECYYKQLLKSKKK